MTCFTLLATAPARGWPTVAACAQFWWAWKEAGDMLFDDWAGLTADWADNWCAAPRRAAPRRARDVPRKSWQRTIGPGG